jgi:DnaJ-class molecular chaperone
MSRKKQKRECDICGGTGQVSYFKGVSRFLLSTEECDECAGTGFQLENLEDLKSGSISGSKKAPGKKK